MHEHREQDPLHAGALAEHAHRTRATPHLAEAALDGVGSARGLAPGRILEAEELQEFVKVLPQTAYRRGIELLPSFGEAPRRAAGRGAIVGMADAGEVALDPIPVRLLDLVQDVARLVVLMPNSA